MGGDPNLVCGLYRSSGDVDAATTGRARQLGRGRCIGRPCLIRTSHKFPNDASATCFRTNKTNASLTLF